MVERNVRNVKVRGSTPLYSTKRHGLGTIIAKAIFDSPILPRASYGSIRFATLSLIRIFAVLSLSD